METTSNIHVVVFHHVRFKKKTANLEKTHLKDFYSCLKKFESFITWKLHQITSPIKKRTWQVCEQILRFFTSEIHRPQMMRLIPASHVVRPKLRDRSLRPLHLVNLRPSKTPSFSEDRVPPIWVRLNLTDLTAAIKGSNLFQPSTKQEENLGSNMIKNHHLIIQLSPKIQSPRCETYNQRTTFLPTKNVCFP